MFFGPLLLLLSTIIRGSYKWNDGWTQLERWGRHGQSVLRLVEPARVGGTLQGQVDTGILPKDADEGPFDIELCRYQWQLHFKKNEKKAKNLGVEWSESATVQGHVPDGNETVHVPISFDLPADQPPTPSPKPPDPEKGGVFASSEEPTFPNWELHVEEASSDSTYESTFRVPVEEAPSSDEVETEKDFWAAVEGETDAASNES